MIFKAMAFGALLLAAPALAQDGPPPKTSDKLPPANPIPYAPANVEAVMAPVKATLAGIAAHDAAAIQAQLVAEGGATVVVEGADGSAKTKHLTWPEFLAGITPSQDGYEERLSDPAVESDGHVALVWSPYVFYLNGTPHHCGTDHFDLVKQAAGWKIVNITWSQRSTGCSAQ
jgi:hypothetical protein